MKTLGSAYLLDVDLNIQLIQAAIDCVSVDYCYELSMVLMCIFVTVHWVDTLLLFFARVHSNNIIDIDIGSKWISLCLFRGVSNSQSV